MLKGKGFWVGLLVGASAVLLWGFYLYKEATKPTA